MQAWVRPVICRDVWYITTGQFLFDAGKDVFEDHPQSQYMTLRGV
ncbi:MAG: hypothetical protein OHK0029_23840 [Armatimonadaceae bacterium]